MKDCLSVLLKRFYSKLNDKVSIRDVSLDSGVEYNLLSSVFPVVLSEIGVNISLNPTANFSSGANLKNEKYKSHPTPNSV